METPGKHLEQVTENFWFVFLAYLLAIAAWYTFSANAFISSRWRTVAETRTRGQRRLFVLSLGMSYLAVYIYFQAKFGDYKEVCLTFMAFAIALLHMLRTGLGLWQLHVFKHWAVRSICSMRFLGYRIQSSRSKNRMSTLQGRSSAAALAEGRDRAHIHADSIIVNNTIVGNRLSEGYVQCYLQFFTPKQKEDILYADSFLLRVLLTLFHVLKSAVYLCRIIWPLFLSRSSLYSTPDSTPFLRPREPEELWLRWATVLVSCAFPNWVADMRKSRFDELGDQVSEYQVYRDRFAEDILRSAALHCERDTTKTSSGVLLPFHFWRKFPKLCTGTFCKQEFLKHACTTGHGLPFQAPHKHAASRREQDVVYSYAKYGSKLQEARDSLPVKEGVKLPCVGIQELEWLSIFLSVGDRSIGKVEEDYGTENLKSVQPPKFDSSGIAIENLCNQLGFPGNMKDFSERLSGPFLKGKGASLWGNRNVLALSAHVDNWLALLAGEEVDSMEQQVPGTEEGFLFRNLKAKDGENRAQEPFAVTEGIPGERIHLEKRNIIFQLSVADPELLPFEQSLTFLGCSMENLRSSMAKWVENNPEEQSGAWEPTLGLSNVSTDARSVGRFVFHASKDFELCLAEVSSVSCWSQRYLQMRLLWELQNNLHNTLSKGGLSPKQSEAILLCILSFPAIRMIASETKQSPESTFSVQGNRHFCCIKIHEKSTLFCIEDCKLSLQALKGPQNVNIEIFFTRRMGESGIVVTAQLCGDEFEEGKQFVWEVWRDSFYRSLQSTQQWKVEHQVANSPLSVLPRIGSIGEGIREIETVNSGIGPIMNVWKGWPPHKETLSKYEMMTDGLILEQKKTTMIPTKASIANGKGSTFQYVPVSYQEAKRQYLTHASLIAHDFLRKAAGYSLDETVGESSKRRIDLELQRYEILATKADEIALDKAMSMLISGNSNRKAIERAVGLLEGCYISEAAKASSVRILESLSRPVRKQNWVKKIKGQYEELMAATSFNPITAISFAGFCSAVPSYHRDVMKEDSIRALITAIVRSTYSKNIVLTFELSKSLELLIGTGTEEWYYLACLMTFNTIEYASKILRRVRKGFERRGRMFFFRTFENSYAGENIPLFPEVLSELKKAKACAQDRLEKLFEIGTYGENAFASRAEELYSQAADDGDLVSAYHLGFLFENCVPPDPSTAMELYTRAMKGGIASAVSPLAGLYAEGKGVSRNVTYAVELYTRAIEERGDTYAMYRLAGLLLEGVGVPADPPRAFQLLSRAVEEGGDVDSITCLASMAGKGAEGVPKDTPYALRLYERAVKEGGDHRAKHNLGHLLASGADGVPVDMARAIALYQSAIDEGENAKAMFKLGQLYLKGTGVRTDAGRAKQLFQRIIDMDGQPDALVHLADVLLEGAIGVPQDPARAVELYTRAIEEHGSGDAMFKLASALEFGKHGVPLDSARAFSLYNRAASEKKHSRAARRLRKVEKQKQVLEQVQDIWSK